jgi:hypothetical protein
MKTPKFAGIAVAASALAIVGLVGLVQPGQTTEKAGAFPQFVRVWGCELIKQENVIILKGPDGDRAQILTTKEHEPPFALRVKAKTDSKNLRLYYNMGIVILNWEGNENELRIHDPVTSEIMGVNDQGRIEPDKYHDIAWEVYPDGMRVLVDGKERARRPGDYAKLKAPLGIGPAFGSVITVESFRVEALKGKLPGNDGG